MKKIIFMLMIAIAVLATGCGKEEKKDSKLDEYLASVKEQADVINNELATVEMTQDEMNEKSAELKTLWRDALAYVLEAAEGTLKKEDFADLKTKQEAWLAEKDAAVEAAGKGMEGGSIYALIVNCEDAIITEERVYEIYELLK